jgi:hypothetical protein
MRGPRSLWPLALVVLLLLPSAALAAGAGHYLPSTGDGFNYYETIFVTNGRGNYSGYTDEGYYNGSVAVTQSNASGIENASYQAGGIYVNGLGTETPWSEHGNFTFSALNFSYVTGTDNQTGYVHPYVWFYMNNSSARGDTFTILNTRMTVVATDDPFPLASSPTGYVATIYAEGSGVYQRNDAYGKFTASYTRQAYFDPHTGYIVGYVYTEIDTDGAGDGFTYTDRLTDTHTTFSLTPAPAPPSSPPPPVPWTTIIVAVVAGIIVLVIVIVVVLLWRRSHRTLPQHPTTPVPRTMPSYAPPTPINLIPRDQPPVQQVVIRETVKVPCQYCGTLIDSTATTCPKCGATRT